MRRRLRPGPGTQQARSGLPAIEIRRLRQLRAGDQAARAEVQDAGVADQVRLEVRDAAQGVGERFDVVTTFDVLHDSVDPRGILSAIRSALSPDGRYICLEINCADRPRTTSGRLARCCTA